MPNTQKGRGTKPLARSQRQRIHREEGVWECWGLHVWVRRYVHALPEEEGEGTSSLGAGITANCEMPGKQSGPLEEQQALSAQSLQTVLMVGYTSESTVRCVCVCLHMREREKKKRKEIRHMVPARSKSC